MNNTFDKHQCVFLKRQIDSRNTGGPLLPKGSAMTINVRRRDGRLWVQFHEPKGYRTHVLPSDVSNFTVADARRIYDNLPCSESPEEFAMVMVIGA